VLQRSSFDRRLSTAAASRLWAALTAWMSPGQVQVKSSMETDLRVAAAGSAALDAEGRPLGGLADVA